MLLDLGIMINTRKRGPKPSGVVKEVFYARVEPRVKHQLEEFLGNISLGCAGTEAKTEDKGVSRASEGLGVSGQGRVGQKAVEASGLAVNEGVDVLKMQEDLYEANRARVAFSKEIDLLSAEIEELNGFLEVARSTNLDANGVFWKDRALKAEARNKTLEQLSS